MPQIVRNLSAQTRQVGELKVYFVPEFVRQNVRRAMAYTEAGSAECRIVSAGKRQIYCFNSRFFG